MVNLRQELIEGWWTIDRTNVRLVDQNIVSWNPVISWLRRIERLKFAE